MGEGIQFLTFNETEDTGCPEEFQKKGTNILSAWKGGTLCEVSREVYLCWYAGERQERYQIDRDRRNGVFSLDAISDRMFQENGSCFEEVIPSMEEGIEEQVERKFLTEKLYKAIRKLQPDERELICALFFEDVSLRSYARRKGVTHRAVQKWRDAILKELRKLMDVE